MKPGQKLVCIDDNWQLRKNMPGMPYPKEGEIYTFDGSTDIFIYLKEFTFLTFDEVRIAFNPSHFRPVDETFGEDVCTNLEKELQPDIVWQ